MNTPDHEQAITDAKEWLRKYEAGEFTSEEMSKMWIDIHESNKANGFSND